MLYSSNSIASFQRYSLEKGLSLKVRLISLTGHFTPLHGPFESSTYFSTLYHRRFGLLEACFVVSCAADLIEEILIRNHDAGQDSSLPHTRISPVSITSTVCKTAHLGATEGLLPCISIRAS